MGKLSKFLEYARQTKDKAALKVADYIFKLHKKGYSDTDILHKLYNNASFLMEFGQRGLQLVGANPKRGRKMKKKAVRIYSDIIEIRAKKGKDSLYPGQLFKHAFKKGSEILGNPDGSLTIRNKKGKRLWRKFEQ